MPDETFALGQYRLTQRAFMPRSPGLDHTVLEPGAEVFTDLKPGPHMEPLDDAARDNKARAGKQSLDWTSSVPLTGSQDDDLLAERVAVAVAKALSVVLPAALAAVPAAPAAPVPAKPAASVAPPPPPPPPPPR